MEVPHRSVESGERAAAVAARVLVLLLLNPRDERADVSCVGSDGPWRDLAVEDPGCDVGVVGRHLAPAHLARGGGQPDEADVLVVEWLQRPDLPERSRLDCAHSSKTRTLRTPRPARRSATASSSWSSVILREMSSSSTRSPRK